MSHLILSNTDDIENIQHKHAPKPKGFRSWKDYWCDQSGEDWPETCRFRGCGYNADGSAHVVVNYDEDCEYIIPLCNLHKSPEFSETFSVNSGTFAVYIDRKEIATDLVANLTINFGEMSLKGGMRVQNISGTHDCLPRGYRSWRKYYMNGGEREWPETCRIGYCSYDAKGGAHVRIEGKKNCPCVYIVPMCEKHNTAQNKDWLPVKQGTILVRVEKQDTSGPAGTCYSTKCR